MKVYVVLHMEYSDYYIVKVCVSKERALQLIEDEVKERREKYGPGRYEENLEIEEYEVLE
jgi:hypothetical protein